VTVREDTRAWDALEQMMDTSFSQLPVVDEHGEVIGVFSFRSYAIRTLDYRGRKVDTTDLTVAECMEPAEFIPPDDYIDTNRAADWGQIDYILVGAHDDLRGVLTTSDVSGRLEKLLEGPPVRRGRPGEAA
jgi:CBS domain-containing protein